MKRDYAPASNEESLGVSRESHDYYAQRARRWRNRVGLVILTLTLLFWSYTLFFTPFFAVQAIEIRGLQKIQPEEIYARVTTFSQIKKWGIIPTNNIFLLSRTQLINYFKNDARIAHIAVQKNYRERSLTITIEERVPIYILALPDRAFAIDKEGIALIPLSVPPPPDILPIISDTRQRETMLGKQVVIDSEIKLFTELHDTLMRIAPFTNVRIGEPSPDAVTFTTKEGFALYFSLTDLPSAQLDRLKVLLATKIKPEKKKRLQYIDLRFGEKVYYK